MACAKAFQAHGLEEGPIDVESDREVLDRLIDPDNDRQLASLMRKAGEVLGPIVDACPRYESDAHCAPYRTLVKALMETATSLEERAAAPAEGRACRWTPPVPEGKADKSLQDAGTSDATASSTVASTAEAKEQTETAVTVTDGAPEGEQSKS